MSKFANKPQAVRQPNTLNTAGGAAFTINDERKALASVVLTSMLNGDKYYETDASRINRVYEQVKNMEDQEFAAKAMIYARKVGNLRSISHIMASALAENTKNRKYSLRKAIKKAIIRPDDMIEMFAFWKTRHSSMLPNSIRRAFKDLLDAYTWDAYQLNKYKNESSAIKLRDIIKLSHPKDKYGNYKKVIEGTLSAPKTLETMLSSGQSASSSFEELLDTNRLGYMAAIKNIRNALMSGLSSEATKDLCKLIANPERVAKSKMLPFRYVSAWNEIKNLDIDTFKKRQIKDAFSAAISASVNNLELVKPDEKVALIIDSSGSMSLEDAWSNAIAMAASMYTGLNPKNVVVYFFDTDVYEKNFGNMDAMDIIDNYSSPSGGATYFSKPLERLINTRTKVDKIFIISDMQMYSVNENYLYSSVSNVSRKSFENYLQSYKNKVNRDVSVLFWNIRGYDNSTPLELRDNVLQVSGFSDKLLGIIPKIWKNQNALVDEIKAIEI